jgi:hypothetical protein
MIKHDLQKIQNNYFEAGVENSKSGNEIIRSIQNQTFTSTGLYLIFTATLFFFLEPRLDYQLVGLPIRVWLSVAVISASLSLITGLVALKATHNHVARARKKFLTKAQKISEYMIQKNVSIVDEIPGELIKIISLDDIQNDSSKIADITVVSQLALFVISLLSVVAVVIRLMF